MTGHEVRSPGTGTVIEVLVRLGERVGAGQELMVIESMKMEIPVVAERAGTVATIRARGGQHVRERDVLLTLGD